MEDLTDRQRAILRRALGFENMNKPWRRDYLIKRWHEDYGICMELVRKDYMEAEKDRMQPMRFFYVTKTGAAAVGVSEVDFLALPEPLR
jgi:hypothetical protein